MSRTVSWAQLCAAVEGTVTVKGGCVIAIDGMCGSGKSTLAARLAARFHANLFHCDDFYLTPEQRTPARLAEVGGNMDRERLQAEILEKLCTGSLITYRPLVVPDLVFGEPLSFAPRPVNIVEGSYSMHPQLRRFYDLSVFLQIDPHVQQARILAREGPEKLEQFRTLWIPKENAYFSQMNVKNACQLLWTGEELRKVDHHGSYDFEKRQF